MMVQEGGGCPLMNLKVDEWGHRGGRLGARWGTRRGEMSVATEGSRGVRRLQLSRNRAASCHGGRGPARTKAAFSFGGKKP